MKVECAEEKIVYNSPKTFLNSFGNLLQIYPCTISTMDVIWNKTQIAFKQDFVSKTDLGIPV